jgi:predicted metal-dependent hydrolase
MESHRLFDDDVQPCPQTLLRLAGVQPVGRGHCKHIGRWAECQKLIQGRKHRNTRTFRRQGRRWVYIHQGYQLGAGVAGDQRGMATANVAHATDNKTNGRKRIGSGHCWQLKESACKLRKNGRLCMHDNPATGCNFAVIPPFSMPLTHIAGLEIDLVRKKMRSLRLTVYAGGRIRVAVPEHTSEAAVEQFVQARRAWVEQHRQRFAARSPQPVLRYVTGEQVAYLGQPYELMIVPTNTRPTIIRQANHLHLHAPAHSTAAQRQAVLRAWYRQQLKQLVPELLRKWEPVVGQQAAGWGVKQMRTRWGTCNIEARRIWLNLELVKHPLECLEYVVVHELTHLHERLHSARFWGLMDQFMPDWRRHRATLNQVRLALAAPPC